jgi:hypothetical protein
MSDDYVYLWIVMIAYIIFILYLNYMQNMAIVKRDWANLKCNPLYMLTDSLSAHASESSANFQTCIKQFGNPGATTKNVLHNNRFKNRLFW